MDNGRAVVGGTTDRTNKDAPKTIESKEITFFRYGFSCSFLRADGKGNGFKYCIFLLGKEEEQATFEAYAIPLTDREGFDFKIKVPLASLDDLQAIIDDHPVAANNGRDIVTAGLPPNLGSELWIGYASGEGVFARDNSGPVIPNAATEAIYDFFIDLAESHGQDPLAYERELVEFQKASRDFWVTDDKKLAVWIISNQLNVYGNDNRMPFQATNYRYKDGKILISTLYETVEFFSYFKLQDNVLYGFDAQGRVFEFFSGTPDDFFPSLPDDFDPSTVEAVYPGVPEYLFP